MVDWANSSRGVRQANRWALAPEELALFIPASLHFCRREGRTPPPLTSVPMDSLNSPHPDLETTFARYQLPHNTTCPLRTRCNSSLQFLSAIARFAIQPRTPRRSSTVEALLSDSRTPAMAGMRR